LNIVLQIRKRRLARPKHPAAWRQAGFTLIELMIVVSIILILIGIAAVKYGEIVRHSKEAVLHSDLRVLRDAIDHYTLDKQAAPQSLDDLAPGYLREVPVDPITNAKDWVPQYDSVVLSPDQSSTGMVDVHSSSSKPSSNGTPYNEW
jgi:general secretion pathway protein G